MKMIFSRHWRMDLNDNLSKALMDDSERQRVLIAGLNGLLVFVAFFMTVVNLFTQEYELMIATLSFGALCLLNILLWRTGIPKRVLHCIFMLEIYGLFSYFIISGHPQGFSVLWISLLPCFALLIFGKGEGSFFCFLAFLELIFFFWVPVGRSLLDYAYNPTFMLRFPFYYIAIYIISLFMEYVRAITQDKFVESETKFRHLYRHDALTHLNNRYGFYEEIQPLFESRNISNCAVVMLDIDRFKRVNDDYGHPAGDMILNSIADILRKNITDTSKICRWGGEEFLLLLYNEEEPERICEVIRKRVEDTAFQYEGSNIRITISMGICKSHAINAGKLERMIRVADDGLYNAKNSGRNLVVVKELDNASEAGKDPATAE
ncbi:MAG: GGDEF domain-containing protein [Blautia sp.]|nr:GGDEF domain-containing protein [Blautia sp.]